MNKRELIEEMARDIFEPRVAIDGIDIAFAAVHGADRDAEGHFMRIARHLYKKGYRKSEAFLQPHENGGEWISVKDRLPEKERVVLCCLGLVMNVYTYKGDNTWEDDYGYWQKDEPITHWMPLPSLPQN